MSVTAGRIAAAGEFGEYFEPFTGPPLGSLQQSWTAAVALDWSAEWGTRVMTISVLAGNEGAVRFYRREGAMDYLQTLIMPVRRP